ncbi:hypothetical protein RHSIM_Rhsim03G0050200 [Rhododendron simsii]|uniref:Uncharacterized protein n=1 Tax=Rhododendron simsii TaxID=118357 RepID=A0A834H2C6_RHOSS|nr:hypothetical protein RHSIM_Rhsim03G0050200 [Rhododendron simsii]
MMGSSAILRLLLFPLSVLLCITSFLSHATIFPGYHSLDLQYTFTTYWDWENWDSFGHSSNEILNSVGTRMYHAVLGTAYFLCYLRIDVENPVIDVTPSLLSRYTSSPLGAKEVLWCGRVQVAGQSRLKLGSYATAYQVTLAPSVVIPERLHNKIQICFHKNVSRGLCQCEKDEWKSVQNGLWSSVMSPYGERFVDVKFAADRPGSVTVTVKEEFQRWRLLCLALGFILLLLAPVVSGWVPFYYSSSMAIGVLLVIIIILFQGMKLLPTGRKSFFYYTIYGSVLGAGSFLLNYFSMLVNSILVSFGLSEEMHNPVSVFVLLLIVLAGAALGYWIVRKFVISEDGSVDVGVAQFVKWAMRVIAVTFIFQSTLDTPLAMGALGSCLAIYSLFTSLEWNGPDFGGTIKSFHMFGIDTFPIVNVFRNLNVVISLLLGIPCILEVGVLGGVENSLLQDKIVLNFSADLASWVHEENSGTAHRDLLLGLTLLRKVHTMFNLVFPLPTFVSSPQTCFTERRELEAVADIELILVFITWTENIERDGNGIRSPTTGRLVRNQPDHYSTFHRTPNRKKYSKKEWEKFTEESTRQSMAELASSPEFTDWVIKNANRIQLLPDDSSLDTIGSGSDSTDANVAESCDRFSFFKW